MKTKRNLTLIVATVLLIAAACSPAKSSSSVSNPAQPATRNNKVLPLPVTGEQTSNTVQDLQAFPSQQLHRDCVSADSQMQGNCMEREPGQSTSLFSSNNNADAHTALSQQLHSDCVSEDSQRQDSCAP